MSETEINFDGIVGPTHNFAGLSLGNLASMANANEHSNPKQAALEGLEKMRFLASLGVTQAVLPPQERPHLPTLRALGYSGTDAQVIDRVGKEDPILLAAVSSSSCMWAANAATVSPSADTDDQRVHFTTANLVTQYHRSIEPVTTARTLRAIFPDESKFIVHDPLPSVSHFADEGAANHTRLVGSHGSCEIFTWGRVGFDARTSITRFPARQTREACEAIARRHGSRSPVFVRQTPVAIDGGAFHNDVVAVGHRDVLLIHEQAWEDQARAIDEIRKRLPGLRVIEVRADQLPLADAVKSYLFNSQLVTVPSGEIHLVAPVECRTNEAARRVCDSLPSDVIAKVHYVDVRQSMKNGGGPACLRLRVSVTSEERAAINPAVMFTEALYESLKAWIHQHYRDELKPSDLRDPTLLDESRRAIDELTRILKLGSIYESQM
jgi:succinylarginine dihydrolase